MSDAAFYSLHHLLLGIGHGAWGMEHGALNQWTVNSEQLSFRAVKLITGN